MRALLTLCLLVPFTVLAQTSELENPGVINAVQERPYRLTHELNLAIGSLPLDAFSKSFYGQLSYIFHFTDTFAWQVGRGAYNYNVKTGLREQLEKDFNVQPTAIDEAQFFVGSDLMISPLYGKFALANKLVLHLETSLILGLSVFKYTTGGFAPAVNAGVAVRLFQNKHVSYRLDISDNVVIFPKKVTNVLTVQLVLAVNFGSSSGDDK
jgi:outer membrane beta-barrel protein